jgi:hypothetical protein
MPAQSTLPRHGLGQRQRVHRQALTITNNGNTPDRVS